MLTVILSLYVICTYLPVLYIILLNKMCTLDSGNVIKVANC